MGERGSVRAMRGMAEVPGGDVTPRSLSPDSPDLDMHTQGAPRQLAGEVVSGTQKVGQNRVDKIIFTGRDLADLNWVSQMHLGAKISTPSPFKSEDHLIANMGLGNSTMVHFYLKHFTERSLQTSTIAHLNTFFSK